MKKFMRIIVSLSFIAILAACGTEKSTGSQEKESGELLQIYTTVYPLQFFTEQIAGEVANVATILPPGTDPHTYEPTSKEMVEMAEADAFIYNGAGLESYAEQIAESIETEEVQILEASKGVALNGHVHNHEGHDHSTDERDEEGGSHTHEEHTHGDEDPHVWLDPLKSITMAENIKKMLVELKPEKEELFQKNFDELHSRLEALDKKFHEELEDLPHKEFIVSHAAYGYWEEAYGIKQIAISGLSPVNEPSQKQLETIMKTAEEHGLVHVFFEQNVTPKVAEAVREEIDAEAMRIHNLAVLTEENIENEETYFTLMERNLEQLNEAFVESPESEHPHHH